MRYGSSGRGSIPLTIGFGKRRVVKLSCLNGMPRRQLCELRLYPSKAFLAAAHAAGRARKTDSRHSRSGEDDFPQSWSSARDSRFNQGVKKSVWKAQV